ncbi:four-carbon acid sugar kinase family protein [Tropicibacter oceani]|uniref:Four-carbon acid sugar kinase family protein n=1 Tax=Tropicibacter oceani TaxID=3058420 RepID=A0ABY8QKG6_9RHOB|nr:four-carbon acid sugar kinase family protein [Tropicibacter oceani]WGW05107.1 four-carbon acid sugar kinase family protein [Tropicibacter oceani]
MTQPHIQLPAGPLVAWYGDDFTGAAAVMEVLTFAGLKAMLFLDPPSDAQLARYPDLKGIGVASTARAQSPDWMDAELPGIFARLAALKPALMHYKVCSTLDSSPTVGSIGRAMEIGAELFAPAAVPVLVAAPQMRRYQSFGHLFAGFEGSVYRLDRHPVMSRHPVTPMNESDVAKHIALQSDKLDARCLSMEQMLAGAALPMQPSMPGRIAAITLDSVDARTETIAGRLIWEARHANPFVVGSQGVEYALVRHWRDMGWIADAPPPQGIGTSDRMIVVSGSVSPTTADQIAWAKANGFASIAFDATCACAPAPALEREVERCVAACLAALARGSDPLVHTAEGPDDPAVHRFRQAAKGAALSMADANQRVGEALGRILKLSLVRSDTRRAVVSGGDTSGHATRQLGIFALSALAPTIPGASLFRAHADGPMDGLELALKGGQMGSPDYFGWIRSGGGTR